VARAKGVAGANFISDVSILNADTVQDLLIDAVYYPDGRGDVYTKQLTLRGGEMFDAGDVVARLFNALDGGGSLRLDLSHPRAVALARTYDDQPFGTAGFSNGALRGSGALSNGERGIILQHWLPGYRTNIGFTEIAGAASEITIRALDERGAFLGAKTVHLAAFGRIQINGDSLFQNRGRLDISVSGGKIIAYASTVDNQSNDPIVQFAERESATTLLIPVVAHLAGGYDTTWRSDVRLLNPSSNAATVIMELRTPDDVLTRSVTLAGGEMTSWDDVIPLLFPQLTGNVSGALAIMAQSPVFATSRTYNVSTHGTYGLYAPARRTGELFSEGETAWLIQLRENESYRTNFGLTSLDSDSEVLVRAFDANGMTTGIKRYSVAAGKNMQIGSVLRNLGIAGNVDSAGLEVKIIAGRVLVYASVNDNYTGDGTYVEAAR
jgi:hypothetical protein